MNFILFGAPWALLALLALPLLPRKGAWWWRYGALALLILALAQPTVMRPSEGVAVLVDVSQSVGESGLDALRAFDFRGLETPPAIFTFAGDATLTENAGAAPTLNNDQSDLARALQVAAASGAGRALLISDGAQSRGDARLALPGFPVDTYRTVERSNVRLVSLLAPEQVSPGETVEVIAVVESDRAAEVTLNPSVNGAALEPVRASVDEGRTPLRFSLPVGDEGNLSVDASLEVGFAQPTADDAQRLDIAVAEEEPVLVINDPATADLLETQGFSVTRGEPADITTPLNYSAIVLRESAEPFTPGQLTLLERYVSDGGGLMMTGGPESFGLGAWYRTPVEAVLPVNTDLRTNVELPLVAMVIVLDRSQSMSTGNPSKIDLAKEGAIGVVELAYEQDLLGLITFSDEPEWAFRPREATSQGKREMLAAILDIPTQGGTVLEPAYQEALASLRESDAAIKHVIILSDGRLNDGRGPFGGSSGLNFTTLAQQGAEDGITTSAIAIGDGADFARLEDIANAGAGRYYAALDVSTLPRIFTSEALTATRSLLREDPLRPVPRAHPLAPNLSAPPTVNAYVASSLKSDGELILEGANGEPILAVSRQGLGRSAALTTDLNTFAGDFASWEALPGVLGTLTRWLQARPAEYSATVTPQGGGLSVVVDAVKDGEYINDERLSVRYNGVEKDLEQVAPGRYEGRLDTPAEGGTLLVSSGGEVKARAQVRDPKGEFNMTGAAALLREVSGRSGGDVIEEAGLYAPTMPRQRTAIWHWLALLGLGVFMLELLVRRFGLPSFRG